MGGLDEEDDVVGLVEEDEMGAGGVEGALLGGGILDGVGRRLDKSGGELGGGRG